MNTEQFIAAHREEDVSLLALRVRQYPEVDAAFALQQIEGWQKAKTKLPTLAATDGWLFPKRLSMEQCSSEETARLKKRIAGDFRTGADLTGGFGIDTFYLSQGAEEWHYVEMQEELCLTAEHNFSLTDRRISVHHTTAERFLAEMPPVDLCFLDPARRNEHGGKVFRLEDCTPDLTQLYPMLMQKANCLMLKLSPMLDLQQALRHLPDAKEVYIVALRGEVKELLIVCKKEEAVDPVRITAVNLLSAREQSASTREEVFCFTEQEENAAEAALLPSADSLSGYLYEPNAAILKAGAFRLISKRFALRKLATNTHLYQGDQLIEDFPGRTFRIKQLIGKAEQKALGGQKANILTRNHPLRPEEIRKKLRLQDGGEQFVIGARIGEKAVLILAERIEKN